MFRSRYAGISAAALGASCVALAWWGIAQGWFSSGRPVLVVPELRSLDLGEGEVGKRLEGVFAIKNGGGVPLTFAFEASCACAGITPKEGSIEPYGKLSVSVAVILKKRGQEENVLVRLRTNDPLRQVVEFRLSAKCPASLISVPTTLFFGQTLESSTKTLSLDLLDKDHQLVEVPVAIVHVPKGFTAKWKQSGKRQQLEVCVQAGLSPGTSLCSHAS